MIALLTHRLAGPIATGAAILLALALAVTQFRFMDMRGQRDDYRDEVRALTADLAQCHTNTAALQSSLDAQNAAVASLEARTVAMREAQAAAMADADRLVQAARSRAAGIRNALPTSDDDCDAAGTLASQILFGER